LKSSLAESESYSFRWKHHSLTQKTHIKQSGWKFIETIFIEAAKKALANETTHDSILFYTIQPTCKNTENNRKMDPIH